MILKEENIEKRWEEGVEHHPMSIALMEHIQRVDLDNGGMLDWKYGGDGDNGEALMYEMDSWFENFFAEKIKEGMQESFKAGVAFWNTSNSRSVEEVAKNVDKQLQDLFNKYGL